MRDLRWTFLLALFAAALWTCTLAAQQPQAGDFTNDSISGQAMPSPTQPGATAPERKLPDNQALPGTGQEQNQNASGKANEKSHDAPAVSAEHRKHHKAAGDNVVSKGNESMTASLLDETRKAQDGAATVIVRTRGVKMTDPDEAKEQPVPGEAHLHYRVDDGPVIASTGTKMDFHELKPGVHTITVMLAGNDHHPLGPQQTLTVSIPSGARASR